RGGRRVSTIVHSARLVDGAVVDDAWACFGDDGRVSRAGTGESWLGLIADDIVDAAGGFLAPGFIDLHGHGGAGVSYDDGPDAVRRARRLHRAHGTTRAVISLLTAPLDELAARVAMVADLAEADAGILGSHLEGPFLDPAHRGAHDETLLIDPAPDAVARLLDAGRGTVRQVTIAPELPGGLAAIGRIVD